jgi:hypothetical protein
MMVYIVLQLRCGDIISMHKMFTQKIEAFKYLSTVKDTETSWWKIVEFKTNFVKINNNYDVVVRVNWKGSNRAFVEDIYDHGYDIPDKFNSSSYFVETLLCE